MTVEGPGGYWEHGRSEYDCIYDKETGYLKYDRAEHTELCATCNGFRWDKDEKKFYECEEEHPELIDMGGAMEMRYDNTPGIIRIVEGDELNKLDSSVEYVREKYGNEIAAKGLYVPDSNMVFFRRSPFSKTSE